MARINVNVPQPTTDYEPSNQEQQLQALDQIKNQLNTSYQEELKQEIERFTWFNG